MRFLKFVFVSSIFLIISACDKEERLVNGENCATIENAKILSDTEKPCVFSNVYFFESQIYTVYICCVCNQIDMAINCDGIPLCNLDEGCMDNFFQEAEYLFSVEAL